jgi:integrase
VRTLPLDAGTIAALKALRRRQLEERLAAGAAYQESGNIAVDEVGEPLTPHRYSAEFARLCREAGVPVIRLHDARHSINSLLAKRGVPPQIRALWLGHSPEINQTTYTHPRPEDLAMITAAIGDIYSTM